MEAYGAYLDSLRPGDAVTVESPDGERHAALVASRDEERITLATGKSFAARHMPGGIKTGRKGSRIVMPGGAE